MRISDTLLEQLNAQADLVAIIRRHTPLKPAGREFKGCCPFHGEKTPSFYVNPESNLYYCFGCGAKGNAISFLVDFERLSFIEAAKTLSEQTGIELPKEDNKQYQYQRGVSTPLPTAPEPPINTFDIESKN
ncbi:MAG: CHC2 zinc finger domain-containing protein, partial [Moraxella sp.]|nr:CHC2 zinc finger domain-containing protein [Moraxella sp.]